MPPIGDISAVDIFMDLVLRDLTKLKIHHSPNCTPSEFEAIRSLERDSNIIIKSSDKGGNTVLMDRDQYITMCNNLLSDMVSYKVLPCDPTDQYQKELLTVLLHAKTLNLIGLEELEYLYPLHPKIATFYSLPKIHKGLSPLKGRPIVSGIDSLTQNSGVYIDKILRPFVETLPSYTRDTTDLLQRLEGITIEDDWWLASVDVEALYTCIPHHLGLDAVKYFLNTRGHQYRAHGQFMIDLLQFTLSHNYFLFSGKTFHQLRGTAMGSPWAPSYANLYLGWWEATTVFGDTPTPGVENIGLWARYIDDVFVIWQGTQDDFRTFINLLNQNSLGLHFTYEIEKESLAFLDVLIRRAPGGELATSVYRKPSATNALLNWQSSHPFPLKKGIPKGQYLRLRRNCSSETMFQEQAKDLRERFKERGYPDKLLRDCYKNALAQERASLLVKKRTDTNEAIVRVIGTFDEASGPIKKILTKHWNILGLDPDLRDVVGTYPQVTYRRGSSLRDKLTKSHLAPISRPGNWLTRQPIGCFKCSGCVACAFIEVGSFFVSSQTGRRHQISQFFNCRSSLVIYRAKCLCGIEYVGKTTRQLRRRVGDHLGDIRHQRDTSIARHVWTNHKGDPNCIKFMAIDKIQPGPRRGDLDKALLQKESFWIFTLKTVTPGGLNEQLNYTCFI